MRHTARDKQVAESWQEGPVEPAVPVSTIEQPLMEELHAVSSAKTPAWKTPSVVVSEEKKDPFRSSKMFVSIDEEYASPDSRPIAPSNATILSEKEVKERFSYSDDQLVYREDMTFGQKAGVTFRKVAVWFSDQWDKYVLFMKKHFPALFETHDTNKLTTICCGICFIVVAMVVIGALIFR